MLDLTIVMMIDRLSVEGDADYDFLCYSGFLLEEAFLLTYAEN
jgi:hypothetical protein